jgi:hypothetical protein
MAVVKKAISNDQLVAILSEMLRGCPECAPGTSIAVLPLKRGEWTVLVRKVRPQCAELIKAMEKKLREIYRLKTDRAAS